MDKVYIYGLIDPQDRQIHYIGHTINTSTRLYEHIRDCTNTPKTRWIASLVSTGLHPELVVLDCVNYADRHTEEYRWIYLGRDRGWPLTNTAAMRTMNYTQLANAASSHVFVEIDKPLTWRMFGEFVREFFTGDWLEERYLYWRMAILNLSVLLMAIGMIMIGPGSVALELPDNISPWVSYAVVTGKLGMYIFFTGAFLIFPFALPLFVKRIIELIVYIIDIFLGKNPRARLQPNGDGAYHVRA